ncbi:family with sequence similarity [Nesidiocoris tenuis]|uniref:Family with sequence similarity n=1 Tax=Nesidiocoris tenuis TaxID=355587 RepID=A0ABN7ACP4_9HEMI|nr:family with sequence similarity [Nesidiocoris tenuis]
MASSNSAVKMDVDNPLTLKRSSSAPMINELNSNSSMMSSQPTTSVLREPTATLPPTRLRRFSTSCSPVVPLSAGGPSSPKLHRVTQLRREESADVLCREAAHERELNSAMHVSLSCEDLSLISDRPKTPSTDSSETNGKNGKGLHLNLTSTPTSDRSLCSTPSPTRMTANRQFITFKSSLTPSPNRSFSRRSQSPIAMRPAQFNVANPVKRKFDLDDNERSAKKFASLLVNNQRVEEPMVVINESDAQRPTNTTEQPD